MSHTLKCCEHDQNFNILKRLYDRRLQEIQMLRIGYIGIVHLTSQEKVFTVTDPCKVFDFLMSLIYFIQPLVSFKMTVIHSYN